MSRSMTTAVNAMLTRVFRAIGSTALVRMARGTVTVLMLPALLFGSFASGGLLIHDHHEHDTHIHRLAESKTGGDKLGFGQIEERHDHDGLPSVPWDEDTSQVLILHDLVRLARSLSISSFAQQLTPKISATVALTAGTTGDRFVPTHSDALAGNVCADSTTTAILLTNHALLL